jgi:hypothetical protein
MIYPQGSELLMAPSCDRSEYGKLVGTLASFSEGSPEFAQEYSIKPGDTIFVLGTLRENPWAKKDPISECNELSRIGPGFIGPGEADLLRREAYPYLDPKLPAGAALSSPDAFDLQPPVILMRGDGPFIISTDSQRELVARLNWKSLVYIWGRACGNPLGFVGDSQARRTAGISTSDLALLRERSSTISVQDLAPHCKI